MAKWKDQYNLDDIYPIIMGESNEALTAQQRGWSGIAELYWEQWQKLGDYKEQIQESWDSPAGDAYVAELDKVMTTLLDNYSKASGNGRALYEIGNLIGGAQRDIVELLDEFDKGPLAQAKQHAADEVDEWHDGFLGMGKDTIASGLANSDGDEITREKLLESSGYNSKGKTLMETLGTQIHDTWYNDIWKPVSYKGPENSAMPQYMGTPPPAPPATPGAPAPAPPPAAPPGKPAAPAP
ncbi:MAG: hypothetical protein ACRDT6_22565, partial [Micromonosporaceae bacterium]